MNPESIIDVVAELMSVGPDEVRSKSRAESVAYARQGAAWVLRRVGLTYPDIARRLLYKHHSGAIYAERAAIKRMKANPFFRAHLNSAVRVWRRPMNMNELIDSYYAARADYEDAKRESDKRHRIWRGKEHELIDAMLSNQLRSISRDDGTAPHLKQSINFSCTKDNEESIRQWLLAEVGDDSDYVEEKVSKSALGELIKKRVEEGRDSDLPEFLNVSTRPTLVVNGWRKFRGEA